MLAGVHTDALITGGAVACQRPGDVQRLFWAERLRVQQGGLSCRAGHRPQGQWRAVVMGACGNLFCGFGESSCASRPVLPPTRRPIKRSKGSSSGFHLETLQQAALLGLVLLGSLGVGGTLGALTQVLRVGALQPQPVVRPLRLRRSSV